MFISCIFILSDRSIRLEINDNNHMGIPYIVNTMYILYMQHVPCTCTIINENLVILELFDVFIIM